MCAPYVLAPLWPSPLVKGLLSAAATYKKITFFSSLHVFTLSNKASYQTVRLLLTDSTLCWMKQWNNISVILLFMFCRISGRPIHAPCATLLYQCHAWLCTEAAKTQWNYSVIVPVWHRTNCVLQLHTSFKVLDSKFSLFSLSLSPL